MIGRCQGDQRIPIEIAIAVAQQAAQGLHYAHEAHDSHGRPIGLGTPGRQSAEHFVTYQASRSSWTSASCAGRRDRRACPACSRGSMVTALLNRSRGPHRSSDRRLLPWVPALGMLTGARLFDASNDATAIDAVRSRRIEPPSALRSQVPRGLDEIVLRRSAAIPTSVTRALRISPKIWSSFCWERDVRPSVQAVGQWLELIFGSERAALKKAISQGGAADGNVERLVALESPKPATGEGSGSVASSSRLRRAPSGPRLRDAVRSVVVRRGCLRLSSGSSAERRCWCEQAFRQSAGTQHARACGRGGDAEHRRSGRRAYLVAATVVAGLAASGFAGCAL